MKNYLSKILCRFFFIFHFSFFIFNTQAQDSPHLRISLLTCTPGEELYSLFGHSAFRVTDSTNRTDIVYNYGTFNFEEDGFYLKFLRGKLPYYVSVEAFADFVNFYQFSNRGITEQVLKLTAPEKAAMLRFLDENIKEENKYYKYDFFLDNCTTRLRDILKKQHDSSFAARPVMPAGTTFRDAVHHYLDKSGRPWTKLGIDILLGKGTDAAMTAEQMQFLPDNLMKSLDSSAALMITSRQDIYTVPGKDTGKKGAPLFTPFVAFSILLIALIWLSRLKNKTAAAFINGFDGVLFFFTGLLGIILVLMWTATDHVMCRSNYNLLWALPTHALAAFFVNSRKRWVKKYFAFTTSVLVLLLLAWFFLPQQMNNGLLPVVLLLLYRSFTKWQNIP